MVLGAAILLLFFVSSSSEKQGILDDNMAFYLVALLNIGSYYGLILIYTISDVYAHSISSISNQQSLVKGRLKSICTNPSFESRHLGKFSSEFVPKPLDSASATPVISVPVFPDYYVALRVCYRSYLHILQVARIAG